MPQLQRSFALRVLLIAAVAATLATSAAAQDVEMPKMVAIKPVVAGNCRFSVSGVKRPCTQAMYMEFSQHRRSNFTVVFPSGAPVGFSGSLAQQDGLDAVVNLDRIMVGPDAQPYRASGQCHVTLISPTSPNVSLLTCDAVTAQGRVGFIMQNAKATILPQN